MASSPTAPGAPRVRFAPSPTGYLHIGGVRTALFNWLWARKHNGVFILRIEDTDQERSTEESRNVIVDALRWLELDWDEGPLVGGPNGPYFQMERLPIYKEFAERLIRQGSAYRCYCTKEELAEMRSRQEAASGVVSYTDMVFGEVTTPNSAQQDFVLLRSDGVPLYNFGAVVDDVTMGITLVSRGRDHMVNTPPQILLYEALGYPRPAFAHLPMMLAPTGEKLSKRHGAVSVGEYRSMGYSPMGVLNYLARFGWSFGDEEIFSREDLIAKFDFSHVGKADGKFDPKKFADVAFEHLKRPDLTPTLRYAAMVRPFLAEIGITDPDEKKLSEAISTIRERARTLKEAADAMSYYFRAPVFDEKAKKKFLTPENAGRLAELKNVLASLEAAIGAWLASKSLSMKDVAQPARVALTGRGVSPGIYEVLAVLGKDESLARIDRGIELSSA